MHSTARHSSPVILLMLAAALLTARAGMAQSTSYLSVSIGCNGGHYVDGTRMSFTDFNQSANAERGVASLGHGFIPASGAITTHARPGFLRVTNSGKSSDTGPTPPQTFKVFHGTGLAEFGDYLTISSSDGSRPSGYPVTLRTRWRRSGTVTYHDSDVPEGWGGARASGAVSYTFAAMGIVGTGGRGRAGFEYELFQNGDLQPTQVVTSEAGARLGSPRLIDANLRVPTTMYSISTLACFAEGTGNITVELVSIEVLDASTGELLRVNVTSASGHVYPVVQPPVPGLPPLHFTAQSISRDSGSVMFSFASEAGASYRVMGSLGLGLADPWQVLTTLTGQPGVSIATFSDPDATTQPSRFYRVERVVE